MKSSIRVGGWGCGATAWGAPFASPATPLTTPPTPSPSPATPYSHLSRLFVVPRKPKATIGADDSGGDAGAHVAVRSVVVVRNVAPARSLGRVFASVKEVVIVGDGADQPPRRARGKGDGRGGLRPRRPLTAAGRRLPHRRRGQGPGRRVAGPPRRCAGHGAPPGRGHGGLAWPGWEAGRRVLNAHGHCLQDAAPASSREARGRENAGR